MHVTSQKKEKTVVFPTYPIEQNRTKNQSNSNRSIGLGNRTKSNTYFAVSSIFEPIEQNQTKPNKIEQNRTNCFH